MVTERIIRKLDLLMNKMVSVIVPTYNEKNNIVPLVAEIHKQLAAFPHEIIVVDDNSPDGTYEAVKSMENAPYLKPVLRTTDRGFAKSIRCGIENSSGEIIVIMDSDFNHQPVYLPFMVESLAHYDCVSGSRFVYGGRMDTRSRHLMSWIFNIFVRIMTGGQVTDSLYGFIAIRNESLKKVDFDKVFWGYGDYCIRLVYYLQQINCSILQFPAVNGKRLAGEGNSRFFKVFAQYFAAVIKLKFQIMFSKTSKDVQAN